MSSSGKKALHSELVNSKPSAMSLSSRSPSHRSSPISTTATNGATRTPSVRGNPGLSRPNHGSLRRQSPHTNSINTNTSLPENAHEEDVRAENGMLIDGLRERLRKAETASEEYQRHLAMLQTRLDDSLQQQEMLEDRVQEGIGRIEVLETEKTQAARLRREMENNFQEERILMMQERKEMQNKEVELLAANQRLKESLTQRESRYNSDEDHGSPKSPSFRGKASLEIENGQFAPPSSIHHSDSKSNTTLVIQKDKMIEALRLELADAQIKVMEAETRADGRWHELENQLLEIRVINAKLMEDNESFQLLLSEKTLNGDFSKAELMHSTTGLGSLAEELESAEGESENYRRLEVEAKSLKEQNKALTLYIENIIGRLLQHKEFENILDKTPDLMSSIARPAATTNTNKELPPPPPAKDEDPPPSILQRARSVVGGSARRARPTSLVTSQNPAPIAAAPPTIVSATGAPATAVPLPTTENQSKPPSIPPSHALPSRDNTHRRSQSDMSYAAPLVNQMYRGPPSTGSGGTMSPGLIPGNIATRTSYFSSNSTSNVNGSSSRTASASRATQEKPGSSSNSTFSDHSGEIGNAPSPPRNGSGLNNYPGAVMTQSKLRPLRLVQENQEMEGGTFGGSSSEDGDLAARKKGNRGSWMLGWMNRGKPEDTQRTVSGESNAY